MSVSAITRPLPGTRALPAPAAGHPTIPDVADVHNRTLIAGLDEMITSVAELARRDVQGPDHGISHSRRRILELLRERGPQPLGVLAGWLGTNPSTVSRAAEQLVNSGLASRQRDQQDRRRRVLHLSATAAQLLEQAEYHRTEAISRIIAPLSDSERAIVTDALSILAGHIDRSRAAAVAEAADPITGLPR